MFPYSLVIKFVTYNAAWCQEIDLGEGKQVGVNLTTSVI